MKKIKLFFILALLFLTNFALACDCMSKMATNSPVGFWKTIDDVTGKPQSILEIKALANKKLIGKIVKGFPKPGEENKKLCTACEGARHNQPMIGMVIMEDLTHSKDNLWKGGHILNPNTGKTYHCSIQLIEHGQKLKVRGYIGLPLFGRTQVWIRTTSV